MFIINHSMKNQKNRLLAVKLSCHLQAQDFQKGNSSTKGNYKIPSQFYDEKSLKKSLFSLHKQIQNRKYLNSLLATKILFSNGKHEQIMFKHRTKQVFGDRVTFSKNNKIRNNGINSVHVSLNKQNDNFNTMKGQQFEDIRQYKPIFLSNQKPFISRDDRRKSYGIQEADIINFQNKKKGIGTKIRRKVIKPKRHVDFNLVNIKGFAAKISASLTKINRGKISTMYLTKMMNLNQDKQNKKPYSLRQQNF